MAEMDTRDESVSPVIADSPKPGFMEKIRRLNSRIGHYESGKMMTVMNLGNSLIGGGIMTFPAAMYQGGVGATIVFIVFTGIICSFTSCLLIRCATKLEVYTYQEIAQAAAGTPGRVAVVICQFLYPVLVAILFSILVTDNVIVVTSYYFVGNYVAESRPLILLIFMLLFFAPLCYVRNISFLDRFSTLSIGLDVLILLFVVIKFPGLSKLVFIHDDSYIFGRSRVLKAISVTSFAFASQHSLCQVYRNCKHKAPREFYKIIFWAHGIIALVTIAITVFCYATYGVLLAGNMFNYYCPTDHFANITRILFTMTIALTYPFQIFAARGVVNGVIPHTVKKYPWLHYVFTTILILITFAVPMFFSDPSLVVEIGGALTAVPLAYLLPVFIYMKVFHASWMPNTLEKIVLWFIIIYGTFITICSTAFSVFDVIDGRDIEAYRTWCSGYYN